MPDMSPADVAAIVGTFLAAIITGLGLKRGDAERRNLPAADQSLAAGIFVGMDGETQRSILEEIRDMHADMARWREEDDNARRADKERSTDERFAKVEDNQARIVGLLHQLRDSEAERSIDR